MKVAQQIHFVPGTIVVDDRGYNEYRQFARWTVAGVFFVARMKDNAAFEVIEQREPPQNRGILSDQTIELSGTGAREKCPHRLRRVEALREDTGETLVFLTNHHGLGASANAVKTQIWTALISMLLLRYLQLSSRFGWSLSNLVALLRMNLFIHRDLMAWLNEPFATPPDPQPVQTTLAFA